MALDLKRKILLLALAICLVFSLAFTISLAAKSIDHACCKIEKNECLPCLQIETAKSFFRILKLAILFVLFAVHVAFRAQTSIKYPEYNTSLISPITLKIRFNC